MNGTWRRSGMNNPYANVDVAWQRIQDLQREAENRRLVPDHEPVELAALVWLKRGLVGLSASARKLAKRGSARPSLDQDLGDSRKKIA
jgi:hypothetical protein